MQSIKLEHDFGVKQTFDKWNGKYLTKDSYVEVVSPTEDTAIYKPGATLLDAGMPLAYVVCNAYPNTQVLDCLKTIEETTTMRANASGPIEPEAMKEKGITEYKLRSPNSYHVKTKAGKWGMIAYANEIYSVMAGWKKGRFTGGIEMSGWTKDNPEKFEILKDISVYNEKAFEKVDSKRYNAQKYFAETHISKDHRVGVVTTLSMNRYSDLNLGSHEGMSVHVDSGDTEAGMTTMCHFRDGKYTEC